MKLILEFEISNDDIKEMRADGKKILLKDVKEELKERMFQTVEDWVIHGNEPDMRWEK